MTRLMGAQHTIEEEAAARAALAESAAELAAAAAEQQSRAAELEAELEGLRCSLQEVKGLDTLPGCEMSILIRMLIVALVDPVVCLFCSFLLCSLLSGNAHQ